VPYGNRPGLSAKAEAEERWRKLGQIDAHGRALDDLGQYVPRVDFDHGGTANPGDHTSLVVLLLWGEVVSTLFSLIPH
jgi:hypothetical protein